MTDILSVLQDEHENMRRLLSVLRRQLAVLDNEGNPDYSLIQTILDYSLEYSSLYHHPKEDLVFARLRDQFPGVIDTINDLEEEHRKLAASTRLFAEVVKTVCNGAEVPRDYVMWLAQDFLDVSENHMHIEDTTLFPLAEKLLTEADWAEIAAQATDRDDPLFGPVVEDMYRPLRDQIAQHCD